MKRNSNEQERSFAAAAITAMQLSEFRGMMCTHIAQAINRLATLDRLWLYFYIKDSMIFFCLLFFRDFPENHIYEALDISIQGYINNTKKEKTRILISIKHELPLSKYFKVRTNMYLMTFDYFLQLLGILPQRNGSYVELIC